MMVFKGERRKEGPGLNVWEQLRTEMTEAGIKSAIFCSDGIKTLMAKITCLSQRNI